MGEQKKKFFIKNFGMTMSERSERKEKNMENIDKIYDLLDSIKVTRENDIELANIKKLLSAGNYLEALKKMRELKDKEEKTKKKQEELLELAPETEEEDGTYPPKLSNPELEQTFIGLFVQTRIPLLMVCISYSLE